MAEPTKSRSVKLRKRPDQERLKKLFNYDPLTGFLHRKKHGKSKHGRGAGSLSTAGHMQVFVDGALYPLHVIIWVWMTGEWPAVEIDHRNRIKTDNWWDNLREATRSQNCANQVGHSDSKSGVKGVHQRGKRFRAIITHQSKPINLGMFDTAAQASTAYAKAAAEIYGEFAYSVPIPGM